MSEFNLKAVLRQTGLSPETLRAWERRYGAVRPLRTTTGRRLYSNSQVHRLSLLSILVKRGFRIGDIAQLDDLELTKRVEISRESQEAPLHSSTSSRGISDLIEALGEFDLVKLRWKLTQVRYLLSPREFALELVPAVMYRVGTLIEENRFSIAEEHALSQLIQNELRSIYESLEPVDGFLKPEKKMIFATREGDYHEIGLMLSAILCRSHGLCCQYLGPNFPIDSLVKTIHATQPFAIILALARLPADEERVSAQEFILSLNKQVKTATELWIGGSAVTDIKRPQTQRQLWIFESLYDLEKKLDTYPNISHQREKERKV